ncbi:MAG: hypothetical protein ACK5JF_14415 [Oscillospiraceae bacterium]
MSTVEIERKWLMKQFPEMSWHSEEHMEQGYISFSPAVRIRKTVTEEKTNYMLTIKGKGTLSRTEVETPITQEQYEALVPLLAAPPATKKLRRYQLPQGLELECSLVDEGEASAFYYAEIEFATEQQANAFVAPPWFGREVTEEKGYSMAEYCRYKAKAEAGEAAEGQTLGGR